MSNIVISLLVISLPALFAFAFGPKMVEINARARPRVYTPQVRRAALLTVYVIGVVWIVLAVKFMFF